MELQPTTIGAVIASIVSSRLTTNASRTYFDRLSHFPGPFLRKFTNLPFSRSYLCGKQPQDVLQLHEKYGHVVRVAPNELSFSSARAWDDIYGSQGGRQPLLKTDFYEGGYFGDEALSIVAERDPAKHSEMRKYLAPVFSERGVKEQETLISGLIDLFVTNMSNDRAGTINLTSGFNLLTFDIIGELAFGEAFGGVETGKMHPWVEVVCTSTSMYTWVDTMKRFPLLGKIFLKLNPWVKKKALDGARKHAAFAVDLVQKINRQAGSKDMLTGLLEKHTRETYRISDLQLAAHASDFVIAGSETTATALAAASWYLARDESLLRRLRHEICNAFKRYEDINWQSTATLPFLHAVCLEALRMFPPLPLGLPRIVPKGGAVLDGCYVPSGTIVSVNPFAASMNSANFHKPQEFNPDRWLGQNTSDKLNASRPFSTGPRSCLGRNLAWLELHTTLAKIHFMYDIELINVEMQWQRDSEMYLLWRKPQLLVKAHRHFPCNKEPNGNV